MDASEKTDFAVSGDEGGHCIGKLSNGHQIEYQKMSDVNAFSNGQGLNLGIINQYGQLMGEYSRLDDELWFSKPEGKEAMEESYEGHDWNFMSTDELNVDLQKPLNCVNTACDGSRTLGKECSSSLNDSSLNQAQTTSPVSVLRKRRSYTHVRTSVIKRSHNSRCHTSKCSSKMDLRSLGTTFSVTAEQSQSFQSENHMKSPLLDEISEPIVRTKKIDDLLQTGSGVGDRNPDPKPFQKQKHPKKAVKKCLHCESTRTPQWREGPMGQATLCNACGVQYRNGRLFPEYRPLSSPTFDPSLHSNVPKKI